MRETTSTRATLKDNDKETASLVSMLTFKFLHYNHVKQEINYVNYYNDSNVYSLSYMFGLSLYFKDHVSFTFYT